MSASAHRSNSALGAEQRANKAAESHAELISAPPSAPGPASGSAEKS